MFRIIVFSITGNRAEYLFNMKMEKKNYVSPQSMVVLANIENLMDGGFHTHSGINGSLTGGDDMGDPEEQP